MALEKEQCQKRAEKRGVQRDASYQCRNQKKRNADDTMQRYFSPAKSSEKEMGSERSSHNRFPSKEMEGAVMILVEAQKNHCDCDENASGIGGGRPDQRK